MSKHTPGPWVVCFQDNDSRGFTVFAQDQLVDGRIEANGWDDCIACVGLNHDNYEANAELIAMAPTLYALAEKVVRTSNDQQLVWAAQQCLDLCEVRK